MYQFPNNYYRLEEDYKKLFYKLTPEVLVDDQIVVIENFISDKLCDELIRSFIVSPDVLLQITPLLKSKEYAARYNERFLTTDFKATTSLWNYFKLVVLRDIEYEDEDIIKVKNYFKDSVYLNPQLRVYKYLKGHHFGRHYDESVKCLIEDKKHNAKQGRTKWTLLIYLTGDDEFVGGETVFYPELSGSKPISIHPKKGMALLHKHGDDCLQHEGKMVKKGEKWVLRSDVAF